ncbi:hypothetical protein T07_9462 [Trichinella nelsoni]|uniref:Uncharacterized protein n=1 Tax=Trichinella nelsoni TaxID=6336 RepID=A0A0V0S9P6_9BILA|nr:hypothetical protein T07_9462 [Trichinella nelsoni]
MPAVLFSKHTKRTKQDEVNCRFCLHPMNHLTDVYNSGNGGSPIKCQPHGAFATDIKKQALIDRPKQYALISFCN